MKDIRLKISLCLQSLLQRGQDADAPCQAAPRTRAHPPWRPRPPLPHLSESPWVLWVCLHVSSLSFSVCLDFVSVSTSVCLLNCRSMSTEGWSGVQMDSCQSETHLLQMLEWGLWCLASSHLHILGVCRAHHPALAFFFFYILCDISQFLTLNNFNMFHVSRHTHTHTCAHTHHTHSLMSLFLSVKPTHSHTHRAGLCLSSCSNSNLLCFLPCLIQ